MEALHQKRRQRQIPGPALQTNKDCSVVLLKWNGHLVHFNSRQGKTPVHGPGPKAAYWAGPLSLPFNYQQDGEYICLKKRMQSSSRNHARHDIHPARPPASDQHMGGAICAAPPASPVDDEVNVGAPPANFQMVSPCSQDPRCDAPLMRWLPSPETIREPSLVLGSIYSPTMLHSGVPWPVDDGKLSRFPVYFPFSLQKRASLCCKGA